MSHIQIPDNRWSESPLTQSLMILLDMQKRYETACYGNNLKKLKIVILLQKCKLQHQLKLAHNYALQTRMQRAFTSYSFPDMLCQGIHTSEVDLRIPISTNQKVTGTVSKHKMSTRRTEICLALSTTGLSSASQYSCSPLNGSQKSKQCLYKDSDTTAF